ncbi:ferredoxin:protochlorophyllide reductase (ATP-dependent) subunit B [Chloroflexus sp. MS-CIW-1]|jgi:light-independent protochlorophyllide reductase subunit B|uniref:ferredoxin:protochlorophyllide reductase (ATP-dependent) subunit B n=1 Tax=Chloroflexus sp. MS-CIW-1 TaxID=3055768 RepID=UPI002649A95B|nr:ferredoxin:protochlorophyllide reductase (ATP-dependent) subunit B [Chloroflexus sp. MS-CIW-1]MDN5271859.1 ferredoxin:protochlorophyllide reductase (ATP-dependent) subunit B [Chloroflexus sp. MS-CIW-1]
MRLAYWMYEGTAHHGVGRIANSMRNVHAVFHAPQGDDYVNAIFAMLDRTPNFPAMTTSVVSGTDLARGTIRLPDTLRQVEERVHPDLIVVVASCSTILLQENLEIAAQHAGLQCDVMVYDANPYRMQEIVAAESLFTDLVKRYAQPQPRTERPTVNILGPASLGFHARHDLISLRRMLKTLGLEINVVAPWGASIADLRRLPAAWLTIAPYRELGLRAATYLEEQFGVPALLDAPIGVQPTLRWIERLRELLAQAGAEIPMPPLTAFSLDGMSAPSAVPWFARTADMDSFSGKPAFVFGDATHVVGITRFLRDELGMPIAGAGTYVKHQADWVREQLTGYVDDLLVTDEFQTVANRIAELRPELVCGTQMERHTSRRYDLNCMVISPPTHIENHLLAYRPFLGFDGADVIADEVYTTCTLGMEKHLIDLFGDAGLDLPEKREGVAVAEPAPVAPPVESSKPLAESPVAVAVTSAPAPSQTSPAAVTSAPAPVDPVWAADAEAMLKKVPFFVRGRVRGNVEKYARQRGHAVITAEVLLAAKEELGA